MAAPILRLYDSLGVEVTAVIALGQASPGVPTTEQVFTVRNNFGGGGSVDTAPGVYFVGTTRVSGSGTAFVSSGNAFADARALEVRVRAFSGGATGTVTGFRNSPVLLGTIPDGGQVEIGVRVRATAASATSDWELAFALEDNPIVAMKDRLFQGLGNFVYDGRPGGQPDPEFSAVYSKVGGLAPDSPADDSVDVWTTVVYAHEGVWLTYTGTEEVFNATDGDSATLASGEAYYATLSLGAAGTLTITKGSKGTAPLTDADKAAVPTGEILAGYVLVPFGLVIDTVEDVLALGFWAFTVTSGLSVEIAAGQGPVGGNFKRDETATEATLADASTLTIWRTPTTGFEIIASTADPTDLQSMPLWGVTTSGGAVTATVDRRVIGAGSAKRPELARVTAAYTPTPVDQVVFANTDGGAVTVTLPAGQSRRALRIVNTGTSANQVTVTPAGAELLLGVNSSFTLNDGESLDLVYDSTDGWY